MNSTTSFDEVRKTLHAWVDEMYALEVGYLILRSEETIYVADSSINRRQAKHIVEQRRADGKSAEEIKQLLDYALETVVNFNFEIPNTNLNRPGSIMRIKLLEGQEKGIVVVMDKKTENKREIITAFERNPHGIQRLIKKKPQESTPGETPHP